MNTLLRFFQFSGVPVNIGFHPSNLVITQLALDPDRTALLERKRRDKSSDKVMIILFIILYLVYKRFCFYM